MTKTATQTLISASRNINLGDCSFGSDQLAPNCPTAWSVRMQKLHGGKQEGVDLITIDNGVMKIRVCPTRGMGIIDVQMGDVRLGWDSPVKEIVHPALIDQQRRGRTGWLEGFNEFLVRCGLEFLGGPTEDNEVIAVNEEPVSDTTLHGKIANIPASEVEVVVQTTAPYAITVRGVVHERAMYGPNYELTAELKVLPGESTFTVADTIRNNGGQAAEFGLMYHINQGKPILEGGARLVAPVKEYTPCDESYPPKDIKQFDRFYKPEAARPKQVYLLDMEPDKRGVVSILLHNRAKDMGLGIAWKKKQLPHFTLWKALHDERDGYVTGLEPGVCFPFGRQGEREAGRYVRLKPGGAYKTELAFEMFDDKAAVSKAAARI